MRLFVVVRFQDNRFTVNTFRLVAAHATLFVIHLHMPRALPSLAILLLLPLRLFLQTAAPTAAAPVMQPAYGQKLHVAGIPNAGKITDLLYRGAQPKEVGFSELKMLGITRSSICAPRTLKKSHGSASMPNRWAYALSTSPSPAGLPQPTNRLSSFSPCCAAHRATRFSCTAVWVRIAQAFSLPLIAWPSKNGLRNKP